MRELFVQCLKDEQGTEVLEYALLLGLIVGGRQCMLAIDGFSDQGGISGVATIDGLRPVAQQPRGFIPLPAPPIRRHVADEAFVGLQLNSLLLDLLHQQRTGLKLGSDKELVQRKAAGGNSQY